MPQREVNHDVSGSRTRQRSTVRTPLRGTARDNPAHTGVAGHTGHNSQRHRGSLVDEPLVLECDFVVPRHVARVVGVFLAYATSRGRALIDRRLCLPEYSWCPCPERRQAAGIPEEEQFAPKSRPAWETIAAPSGSL
ncbi:transposase [Streptomyces sp. TLI_146]|uniref:transposase n=1 Tax=Streptomyces sp. TLI_146 TaxID=1938858 RepID=UPI0035A6E8D9